MAARAELTVAIAGLVFSMILILLSAAGNEAPQQAPAKRLRS
jgi:hypothetical protein